MSKPTLDRMRGMLIFAVLLTLAMALAFGIAGMVSAPDAEAHDLQCSEARARAHHPNANCRKTSANHIWLWFSHRTCQEHVYWSHGGWLGLEHYGTVVHCPSWH